MNEDAVKLCKKSKIKLKTAGSTRVIQFMAGNNKSCPVKNLSKDTYLDKRTGEIKQKKKSENRYQSPKSVRKSINRLMDLIRCNVTDTAKCKWITVTYGEIMTDGKKAFLDTKLLLRKLKRFLAKQSHFSSGQKSFQYIAVAEPQGENHGHSWHMHIILIFEDTAPYLENETISKLWGYGVTDTHAVYDGDGLALYFKAYLSDVEYEDSDVDENEDGEDSEHKPVTVEKMVAGVSKQFIKGERLKYYLVGMKLYSSSRGLKKPTVEEMTNEEAMKRVADSKMVYRETYVIGDKDDGNLIDKRYYKAKDK